MVIRFFVLNISNDSNGSKLGHRRSPGNCKESVVRIARPHSILIVLLLAISSAAKGRAHRTVSSKVSFNREIRVDTLRSLFCLALVQMRRNEKLGFELDTYEGATS